MITIKAKQKPSTTTTAATTTAQQTVNSKQGQGQVQGVGVGGEVNGTSSAEATTWSNLAGFVAAIQDIFR